MSESRRCPGCESPGASEFFEAPGVPVDIGIQWRTREEALACARGDICLAYCRRCGLIFNTKYDPNLLGTAGEYENSLEASPTFRAYAAALAHGLIEGYEIRGKRIVEIGCGTGAFLRSLCELGGNEGIGFDPAYSGTGGPPGTQAHDLRIIGDVYSSKYDSEYADLLCCRHLLDHLSTPRQFLVESRGLLKSPDAVAYFEVPDCTEIFLQPYPWLVIYEHCLYFTPASLARLFTECGYDVRRSGTSYGDTFAFVEAHAASSTVDTAARIADLALLANAIDSFPDRFGWVLDGWHDRLSGMLGEHGRVVLWGAGARSVGFTSAVRAADQIPYVVDLNPRKWGRYLSGTGQEIVPPEFLKEYRPTAVIVMNSIYADEIDRMVREMDINPTLLAL